MACTEGVSVGRLFGRPEVLSLLKCLEFTRSQFGASQELVEYNLVMILLNMHTSEMWIRLNPDK